MLTYFPNWGRIEPSNGNKGFPNRNKPLTTENEMKNSPTKPKIYFAFYAKEKSTPAPFAYAHMMISAKTKKDAMRVAKGFSKLGHWLVGLEEETK